AVSTGPDDRFTGGSVMSWCGSFQLELRPELQSGSQPGDRLCIVQLGWHAQGDERGPEPVDGGQEDGLDLVHGLSPYRWPRTPASPPTGPRPNGRQRSEPDWATVAPHIPAVARMSVMRSRRGWMVGWVGRTSTTCLRARHATYHVAMNSRDSGSTPTSSAHRRTSLWNWSNTEIQNGPSSRAQSWARPTACSTTSAPRSADFDIRPSLPDGCRLQGLSPRPLGAATAVGPNVGTPKVPPVVPSNDPSV